MGFKELGVREDLLQALEKCSFAEPTEIQSKVIPLALSRRNVLGKSPTGSGKTHAYLIPLIQKIDLTVNKVQALIVAPTRELAKQIFIMAKQFNEFIPELKIMLFSSGTDRNKDIQKLDNIPHIVIGTPGRIKDFGFDNSYINLVSSEMVVIDEADMILEEGFLDEVGVILDKLKKDIQILCFSASLSERLLQFLNKYISSPVLVKIEGQYITSKNVEHIAYPTRNRDRLAVLKYLLEVTNPFICIVFASKKETVDEIYKFLKKNNFECCEIHGDLSSTIRKSTLNRIKNNEYSVIVASDMMARGLDIEGVSEVINFDLPYKDEFYFHRAGRTGRADNYGKCYTLYDKDEINKLSFLYKKGVKFINKEYSNGEWIVLKDLFKKQVHHKPHPVNNEIKEIVNKTKKAKVKPNYKKKAKVQIAKIKQKHKREIIEKDIRRQRVERYKEQAKQERI